MGLPVKIETVEEMKARFKAAFDTIFEGEDVAAGVADYPGESRTHVFDFEDGLRMIASKDRVAGKIYFHLSGSSFKAPVAYKDMCEVLASRFICLWGEPIVIRFNSCVSPNGVVHLVGTQNPLDDKVHEPTTAHAN